MSKSQSPAPTFLTLPAEIRLQIYEHVIGQHIIYVRMKWSGICTPAGFLYSCLSNISALLEPLESKVHTHCIPLGPDFRYLNLTCRQIQRETACLPFKSYTWAFETVFTLDQWVSMTSRIPLRNKSCVKRVAVPTPGPYRNSERTLCDLNEVLLIGSTAKSIDELEIMDTPKKAIILLRKDWSSNEWISDGSRSLHAGPSVESSALTATQ